MALRTSATARAGFSVCRDQAGLIVALAALALRAVVAPTL